MACHESFDLLAATDGCTARLRSTGLRCVGHGGDDLIDSILFDRLRIAAAIQWKHGKCRVSRKCDQSVHLVPRRCLLIGVLGGIAAAVPETDTADLSDFHSLRRAIDPFTDRTQVDRRPLPVPAGSSRFRRPSGREAVNSGP